MLRTPAVRPLSTRYQIQTLELALGPELLGYVGGSSTRSLPGDLGLWRQNRFSRGQRRRFELTAGILELFHTENMFSLFRAWMREVDPALERRSPASVMRDSPRQYDALMAAAQRFIGERLSRH